MKDIIYIIFAINCLMVGYHYEYIKQESKIFTTICIVFLMLVVGSPGWLLMFLGKGLEKIANFFGILNFLHLIPLYLGMYNHLLSKEAVEVMQKTADELTKKTKTTLKEKSFIFTHKKVIAYINRKNLAS
jgi:hypothetical protein